MFLSKCPLSKYHLPQTNTPKYMNQPQSQIQICCSFCSCSFRLSVAQQSYYINKGWCLPKKCLDCRRLSRNRSSASKGKNWKRNSSVSEEMYCSHKTHQKPDATKKSASNDNPDMLTLVSQTICSPWAAGSPRYLAVEPHQERASHVLAAVYDVFSVLPAAIQTMLLMQLREYVYCVNKEVVHQHNLPAVIVSYLGETIMEDTTCLMDHCSGRYVHTNGQCQDLMCNTCHNVIEVKTKKFLAVDDVNEIHLKAGAAAGVYRWKYHHGVLVCFSPKGPKYWSAAQTVVEGGTPEDQIKGIACSPTEPLPLDEEERRRTGTIIAPWASAVDLFPSQLVFQLANQSYLEAVIQKMSQVLEVFEREYFGRRARPVEQRVRQGMTDFLVIASQKKKKNDSSGMQSAKKNS